MSSARIDCQNPSRRMVLANGAALALGAAAAAVAVSQAAAQQKLAQSAIGYQGTPKGDQRCATCINFEPPKSCKFVAGDISPNGWCQLYGAKT